MATNALVDPSLLVSLLGRRDADSSGFNLALKARGESSAAGRLPVCSLAKAWRKSSQMMSPVSGQ
jgi:hypothetical protein